MAERWRDRSATIDEPAAENLEVKVSELDISIYSKDDHGAKKWQPEMEFTPELQEKLALRYAEVFKVFREKGRSAHAGHLLGHQRRPHLAQHLAAPAPERSALCSTETSSPRLRSRPSSISEYPSLAACAARPEKPRGVAKNVTKSSRFCAAPAKWLPCRKLGRGRPVGSVAYDHAGSKGELCLLGGHAAHGVRP